MDKTSKSKYQRNAAYVIVKLLQRKFCSGKRRLAVPTYLEAPNHRLWCFYSVFFKWKFDVKHIHRLRSMWRSNMLLFCLPKSCHWPWAGVKTGWRPIDPVPPRPQGLPMWSLKCLEFWAIRNFCGSTQIVCLGDKMKIWASSIKFLRHRQYSAFDINKTFNARLCVYLHCESTQLKIDRGQTYTLLINFPEILQADGHIQHT